MSKLREFLERLDALASVLGLEARIPGAATTIRKAGQMVEKVLDGHPHQTADVLVEQMESLIDGEE